MLAKNKISREINYGEEKITNLEKLDSINIYSKILPLTRLYKKKSVKGRKDRMGAIGAIPRPSGAVRAIPGPMAPGDVFTGQGCIFCKIKNSQALTNFFKLNTSYL